MTDRSPGRIDLGQLTHLIADGQIDTVVDAVVTTGERQRYLERG